MNLSAAQISVSNNHVYCALKSGTVKDLTASGYVHPAAKQCNYNVTVVDNLTTSSSTSALSAKQGQELNTRLAALENAIDPSRMQILTSFTENFQDGDIRINRGNSVPIASPQNSYNISNISLVYCTIEYDISYSGYNWYQSGLIVPEFYVCFGDYQNALIIFMRLGGEDYGWNGDSDTSVGTFTQVLYIRNGNYYEDRDYANRVYDIPYVIAHVESPSSGTYAQIDGGSVTVTVYGR